MASTELVTAICERIIEKLRKENPGVEYKHKPKEAKCPKSKEKKITTTEAKKAMKKMKKPRVLN